MIRIPDDCSAHTRSSRIMNAPWLECMIKDCIEEFPLLGLTTEHFAVLKKGQNHFGVRYPELYDKVVRYPEIYYDRRLLDEIEFSLNTHGSSFYARSQGVYNKNMLIMVVNSLFKIREAMAPSVTEKESLRGAWKRTLDDFEDAVKQSPILSVNRGLGATGN
eukprot:367752_1